VDNTCALFKETVPMQKRRLNRLALMGILGGLLAVQHAHAETESKPPPPVEAAKDKAQPQDPSEGNLGYHLMTEDELMLELNPEGIKLYKSLDAEGKKLALEVASQRCGKSNKCAGLNACQTDYNACAGKGPCAGKGKCALADKNLAVKIVADKMAKKRAEAAQQPE
jgi:hypothetical protein